MIDLMEILIISGYLAAAVWVVIQIVKCKIELKQIKKGIDNITYKQ